MKYISFEVRGDQSDIPKNTININIWNLDHFLETIERAIMSGCGFAVATLNLDHVAKLRSNALFYRAYRSHNFVTADGSPIVWLGRLMGFPIFKTAGSDLVEPVAGLICKRGLSLAIIGSQEEAVRKAIQVLRSRYPALRVSYTCSPQFGFDPLSADAARILGEIACSGAAVCLIALGAPKQEILASLGLRIAPNVGFISIGAAIDFLAGKQIRAPRWMRQMNVEWVWRLATNPRRLFWRYIRCAAVLPLIVGKALTSPSSKNR